MWRGIGGTRWNAWDEYYASVDAMAERYAEEHDFGYDYDSGESAWEIDNLFSTLKGVAS